MKPTQKKPITAFTVISTIILLLLTILFIFPFSVAILGLSHLCHPFSYKNSTFLQI